MAWLSVTLRWNWRAAPRSAFQGFTVRVTLRPPKLVVEVRCPSAGGVVAGMSAGGSVTAERIALEAVALEALAPPTTTIAAAVVTSTAHRRLRNIRRSPTPSVYRSWPAAGGRPSEAPKIASGHEDGSRRRFATAGRDKQFLGEGVMMTSVSEGFRARRSEPQMDGRAGPAGGDQRRPGPLRGRGQGLLRTVHPGLADRRAAAARRRYGRAQGGSRLDLRLLGPEGRGGRCLRRLFRHAMGQCAQAH